MSETGRRLGGVSPSNKAGFPMEILHLDVKHHVAFDVLVTDRNLVVVKKLKSDPNVLHFFGDGILPKSVVICVVNFNGFFNGFGTRIPHL